MLKKTELVLRTLLMLAVALVTALVLTYLAIGPAGRLSAMRTGPWYAWPNLGTDNAGPYAVAKHIQSGLLPLGANEGIAFIADEDSNGVPLDSNCNYSVDGLTPNAKLWTLSAYDTEGRLNAKLPWKSSVNSRQINRRPDGSFQITISDTAHFGNWLPITKMGSFTLVLRLYDTPVSTGSIVLDGDMPSITRRECT